MKHSLKIVAIMLGMFLLTQLVGIAVIHAYTPKIQQVASENNTVINATVYDLPYGTAPPEKIEPQYSFISIIIAFIVAILLIFFLMKFRAELFLRLWFLFVITLALGITINAFLKPWPYSSLIAIIIALPLALIKVFNRNMFVHNLTEVLVYPGIAAIFVPLLIIREKTGFPFNLLSGEIINKYFSILQFWPIITIFILISAYDMWAVWHSGFMQQMAQYQIKTLKVFSGFFIPYLGAKERALVLKARESKSKKFNKKIKVNVAILGGGDVVFPIMLSGVVLWTSGLLPAIMISIGATIALALLFVFSKKGKFYPAMPFITTGCFIALVLNYLLHLL